MTTSSPALTGVLRTRLLAPRVSADWLPRPSLVERVRIGLQGRLVEIVAGAGYGKSTLLAQAIDVAQVPVVWCSLDERLASVQTLLGHLVVGLAERFPGFGADLSLEGDADLQAVEFCNEVLATIPDDFILALDDVHTVSAGASAEVLALLALHLPPTVHLAMTSRERLPLPMGRIRSAGLLEIGEADLAVSDEEALALVGDGAPALNERAEGWITGLLLAARYGDAPPGSRRDGVAEYLADEVLRREPVDVRELLLDAAVLERFNPSLLAAMDPGRGLDSTTAALSNRLFVTRLVGEGEWYRFHHLFQGVLASELSSRTPADRAERHGRAAAALTGRADATEIVPHLIAAGRSAAALDLIESIAEPMLASPEAETLGEWLDAVPREIWADRPAVILTAASLRFSRAEFEAAFADLEDAVDALLPAGDHERAALAVIRLLQALGAAGGGRQQRGIDTAKRYLARLDPNARMVPAARLMLANMYGYACRYDDVEAEVAAAEASLVAARFPILATYAAVTRAFFIDRPRGRIVAATAALDRAIEDLTARSDQDVLAYLPYAHTYRCVLLAEAGRYTETLAECVRLQEVADQRGLGKIAAGVVAWLRFAALAGLGRWDELSDELEASAISFTRFGAGGRSYLRHAALARLGAERGDRDQVRAEIEAARPGLVAQGYAFEIAVRMADLSACAHRVGLGPLATELAEASVAAAYDAEAPWAATRGALAAAAASSGVDRDTWISRALATSDTFDADGLWADRERDLAAELLPRAIVANLDPTAVAARLAAACGGEIFEACAVAARGGNPEVRARFADLAGGVRGMSTPSVAALLDDPVAEVREAAKRSTDKIEARPRPALAITTYGGFAVTRDGVPMAETAFGRQKARVLLAALVCGRGAVHRDLLLEWLWPDLAPERGLRALQTTIYELRKALEPGAAKGTASVIMSEGETYLLSLDARDSVDFTTAARLLRAAEASLDSTEQRRLLGEADELTAAPFLPEWPYAPWSDDRRQEVDEFQRELLARFAADLASVGRHDAAAARYRRLLVIEPEREAWYRELMRVYAASGERAMALRQYQACRARLRHELGIEPGAETHDLYLEILRAT